MISVDVTIKNVISVKDNKYTVEVEIDTICYGITKRKKCGFIKSHWYDRISLLKSYDEREEISVEHLGYFESMDNEAFYKRFEKTLTDFTDQEIADEFNRRTQLRRITVECTAKVNS